MKYAVISYPQSTNIGDEIQSIAAANLLPEVHYYLPRESLNQNVHGEKIKLICNGFFVGAPGNWPPSKNIDPLFISLHATTQDNAHSYIINPELKLYYDTYKPVGCRDLQTLSMFKSAGINAYFSSCLTLTLGDLFPNIERGEEILFVDALANFPDPKYVNNAIRKIIPDRYLGEISIITHTRSSAKVSQKDRMETARQLLERYARAKLVITSRIHCALPCLAFGTPVFFVDAGYGSILDRSRFGGILELLTTIEGRHFPFSHRTKINNLLRKAIPSKWLPWRHTPAIDYINWDDPKPNPVSIEIIAKSLRDTVSSFITK